MNAVALDIKAIFKYRLEVAFSQLFADLIQGKRAALLFTSDNENLHRDDCNNVPSRKEARWPFFAGFTPFSRRELAINRRERGMELQFYLRSIRISNCTLLR